MREAQRISSIGDWESKVAGTISRWSDEVFRIYGLDKENFETGYDAFLKCVHPDDREAVRLATERGTAPGQPYSYEHRIVRPDG